MISGITIENFKGISNPVTIEFKPITLLFGANSSGKSTIIQAVHYACEIFLRNNPDADTTLFGGPWVNLGGFKNFVRGHDFNNIVKIKMHLDLSKTDLPDIITASDDLNDEILAADCGLILHRIESASVGVEISWDNFKTTPMPVITSYSVDFNNRLFGRISASIGRNSPELVYLDLGHPILDINIASGLELLQNHFGENPSREERGQAGIGLFGTVKGNAIPFWDSSLSTVLRGGSTARRAPRRSSVAKLKTRSVDEEDVRQPTSNTDWILNKLLCGAGRLIRQELQTFRYIGPIRTVPTRGFVPATSTEPGRWADGTAAWDYLLNPDSYFSEINEWLGREHLNCGYEISREDYLNWKILSKERRLRLAKNHLAELMGDGPKKEELLRTVCLRDYLSNIRVYPQDIGVGISQLIPVVVGTLNSSGLLAIEQPELHVHPALQARMGDLLIHSVNLSNPVEKRVLIETHSEHLILRLLRRIREGSKVRERKKRIKEWIFAPEHLGVYFIERGRCSKLRVNDRGDFIDRWPNGFFEERLKEMFDV